MKKEVFAIALLGALIAVSVLNIGGIVRLTDELTETVELASAAAENENWDSAEIQAEKAIASWKAKDSYTHIVLRHSEIDTLSDALYDFLNDIMDKNVGAAEASSQKVIYHLESISQMERLRLGSIF